MNKYTHKGWFGMCPVYIANTYTNCPTLTPRKPWMTPLIRMEVWLQQQAIAFCLMINPEWTPVWKVRITGILP